GDRRDAALRQPRAARARGDAGAGASGTDRPTGGDRGRGRVPRGSGIGLRERRDYHRRWWAGDGMTTTDREELKQKLKELLITGLRLQDVVPAGIADDQPIFVDGLGLDSIDALELVVLIEEHFGVAIPDEEVGKKAFASINALAEFIAAEQSRGA